MNKYKCCPSCQKNIKIVLMLSWWLAVMPHGLVNRNLSLRSAGTESYPLTWSVPSGFKGNSHADVRPRPPRLHAKYKKLAISERGYNPPSGINGHSCPPPRHLPSCPSEFIRSPLQPEVRGTHLCSISKPTDSPAWLLGANYSSINHPEKVIKCLIFDRDEINSQLTLTCEIFIKC